MPRRYRLNRFRPTVVAAGVFVLLALISGAGNISFITKLATAQHQIDDLVKTAAQDSATAAGAVRRAVASEKVRDSLLAAQRPLVVYRDRAAAHADSVVRQAPDTCKPVIAALQAKTAADSILSDSRLVGWNAEIASHDSTKASLVTAQRALAGLAVRADSIKLPRPSFLSKILPQSSVGCTAGVSPLSGRTDAVCGVSVGWRISL